MKVVSRVAAQGDVMFIRVSGGEIPPGAREVAPADGRYVVAHSETGHHHTVEARPGVRFFAVDDFTSYLRVDPGAEHADVMHHRPWDTHATLRLLAGTYIVRRQREYTPQGLRRVED